METISNYLDSIFSNLPQNDELKRLKINLADSMEEKYSELKSQGKSENEAIGIVISEFGNIDEILNELGVEEERGQENEVVVNLEQAKEYIHLKEITSKMIAIGVSILFIGVSILLFLNQALEDNLFLAQLSDNAKSILPVIPLLLFVIPAIAIFIYSGSKIEHFKFIEKNDFRLANVARGSIENTYKNEKQKQTIGVMIGVCICIVAVIPVLVTTMVNESASSYGATAFLVIVAIAVDIFIVTGSVAGACKQLLQLDEYSLEKKKENKVIGMVASIVWPIAVCIFLVTGLVFQRWETNWIIFAITGILFGGFRAVYSTITKANK